ncbi:glycosyltransferase family 4 protein [Parafilimonas sp.]|uniref:glycosyltransferase family 4 protein n=1 Tax=Parafilimonas sp. TaxID=1969739 RepID=UPI0039E48D6D
MVTAFAQEGLLEYFYTTVAGFEDTAWLQYLVRDIGRRAFKTHLKPFTVTHPWREICRQLANRTGIYKLTKEENSVFSIDAVYRSLDRYVSKRISKAAGRARLIYAYEDGSFYSFAAAKKTGLACVYDLPIAYWKTALKLLMEEAERLPEWKNTLRRSINNSPEKLERKTAEMEMADLVIAPSRFVADSVLKEFSGKKILVSPFGTPLFSEEIKRADLKRNDRLRVLFAGSLGQRKGLADLAKAIQVLNNRGVELVVMGSRLEKESFYKKHLPAYTYIRPAPHCGALKVMSSCHVLCLPSIVEGRALVMQEAMSRGLPIIITKNTGGEDLVKEGETGFVVPVRSPEMIAEKINWFAEHRKFIADMGLAAASHARAYSWEVYGETIIHAIHAMPLI